MDLWTAEDKAIIAANHVTAKTYDTLMEKAGGFRAYVKGLGGIFDKVYAVNTQVTTEQELHERMRFVCGLMAIFRFCYWNGTTWWYWLNSASKSFYSSKVTTKGCRGGTIYQLCHGDGGRLRITNCNYGVDTLLRSCGMYELKMTTVTSKSKLVPGDVIDLYRKSDGKWHHQVMVHSISGGKIWCCDFGNRFIKTGKPLHYMSLTGTAAGGEYGTDKWKGRHRLTLKAKEPEPLIKRNTGFMGYNVSPRSKKPEWIVIHYTGSEGSAADNVAYFNSGNRDASADIFVGHQGEILAYNNDITGQYTWHCGGPIESTHHPMNGIVTNINSIGIELCTKKVGNDWTFTSSTVASAVTVTKHLMQVYGIKADHVVRHYDVTGKACPRVPGWGAVGGDAEWNKFKAKLTTEVTVVPRTIKQGNTGRVVKVWQVIVGGLTVDGKFGAKTKAATMKWQKTHGLTADGVVGPKTWNAALKLL